MPEVSQLWVFLLYRQGNEVQQCHFPVSGLGVQQLKGSGGNRLSTLALALVSSVLHMRSLPSYQVQALELEAVDSTSLAAVHVVPQCKYDLFIRCKAGRSQQASRTHPRP